MLKIILTIALLVVLFEQISSKIANKHDPGDVYVEVLTRRFLDLESVLWKEIEQNAYRDDKTLVLKKIHTEFSKFFSRPFLVADIPLENVNIFSQRQIETQIVDVERAVSVVKNHILQREVDRSLDQNVIATTRLLDASLLGNVHHVAVVMNYFALIKEVSNRVFTQSNAWQYDLSTYFFK